MGYQSERDQFLMEAARAGLRHNQAEKLLRYATTIHRLAEAQCNGDWPADNGQRPTKQCPVCDQSWVPSQITGGARAQMAHRRAAATIPDNAKACPDCRTESLVIEALAGSGLMPVFSGDPRGCTLKLYPVGTARELIENGQARYIAVVGRY